MANRTPLIATVVDDAAEIRMRNRGTPDEGLTERHYADVERLQMALWRAVGELRHAGVPPRTERTIRRTKKDLAAIRKTA